METDSKIQRGRLLADRGEGVGGWVNKVKGLSSTNWQLQNTHRDVNHIIGNIVNNMVITMDGARWLFESCTL